MADNKTLLGFTQPEKNIYAQCPSCEEIRRINEFKIIYGKIPQKDLLDNLLQAELEFEGKKKEIIDKASQESYENFVNNISEKSAMPLNHSHYLEDSHFFDDSIDYISFDGSFTVHRVDKNTFFEIKTG